MNGSIGKLAMDIAKDIDLSQIDIIIQWKCYKE